MKHIVIDLEMNGTSNKFQEKCKMEIIQIGVVLLDENYEIADQFSSYVKPQFNTKMENFYENLTGISYFMVNKAPVFFQVMDSFFSWLYSLEDDLEILAWSENDLMQILLEAQAKDYEFDEFGDYVLDNWFDFQQEFSHKLFIDHRCSLKDALDFAGIQPMGHWHDALDDALNTAHLVSLIRNEEACLKIFGNVIELQTIHKNTLGDLFDFSQFVFE
ncbi:exonuclease domain-containing protein [Floccifex sp.]|uniref:exonuclease domain-containing protein n=1 Tax=Floccifex sp. TaxID=2815810 RepID=UPI003F033A0B